MPSEWRVDLARDGELCPKALRNGYNVTAFFFVCVKCFTVSHSDETFQHLFPCLQVMKAQQGYQCPPVRPPGKVEALPAPSCECWSSPPSWSSLRTQRLWVEPPGDISISSQSQWFLKTKQLNHIKNSLLVLRIFTFFMCWKLFQITILCNPRFSCLIVAATFHSSVIYYNQITVSVFVSTICHLQTKYFSVFL